MYVRQMMRRSACSNESSTRQVGGRLRRYHDGWDSTYIPNPSTYITVNIMSSKGTDQSTFYTDFDVSYVIYASYNNPIT